MVVLSQLHGLQGYVLDLKKAYGTTWQYIIIQDLHGIDLKGRLPALVLGYLIDCQICVRNSTKLINRF